VGLLTCIMKFFTIVIHVMVQSKRLMKKLV
jgi:hypothetical protein